MYVAFLSICPLVNTRTVLKPVSAASSIQRLLQTIVLGNQPFLINKVLYIKTFKAHVIILPKETAQFSLLSEIS